MTTPELKKGVATTVLNDVFDSNKNFKHESQDP